MSNNNLYNNNIIYQHAVYGTGTTLTGQSNIRAALIQPDELQAAVVHAKPLFQAHDHESYESDLQQGEYDLQQILQLYNATVIDGRFIDDLATDPKSVAAKLGVELSDPAASEIKRARAAVANRFGDNFNYALRPSKIVAIAIVVVIAIRAESKPYDVVIDSSGLIKV